MHSSILVISLLVGLAPAIPSGSGSKVVLEKRQSSCPSVWTEATADLKASFVGSDGLCTDDARAAIRLSFHDCFPEACDGSIVLSDECTSRGENSQLTSICSTIGSKATQYNVSTADMIQFGTAMGIASCPGGPLISFKVGRTDTTTANPSGQMPGANTDATTLISQFAAKGFTATELVALVGAHSTAKNLGGTALDSTVGDWDVTYYSETADGTAPASINADKFLSNASETASTWSGFAASQAAWNAAFVPAMEKMAVLGNDEASLIDCSSVISDAFA
ncbi:heme peroxidase [Thozetella sp. PMI_491]|nr:heme peroxidase [Thozetella sp. PMI_491]